MQMGSKIKVKQLKSNINTALATTNYCYINKFGIHLINFRYLVINLPQKHNNNTR